MANPQSQGMNNLTTLIKRLEAATSRLEDIASSAEHTPQQAPVAQLPALLPTQDVPPSIEAMDELLATSLKEYESAAGIDPLVQEQAAAVSSAFTAQRTFLLTSTRAKKPDMTSASFPDLIQDLQQAMGTVSEFHDSNRGSKVKEHLAMVSEGIAALQWLVMEGKPADYIGDVIGGAQMYGNRVLKTYKETDQNHVKFVQSYYKLLRSLQEYIKKYYPSGLTWKNDGEDALTILKEIKGQAPPVPASQGPPPPPPPPLPTFDDLQPKPASDMDAVFAALNKGSDVTKGLKKVDKSQMTHKNPELRQSSVVSRSRSRGPETKPKPVSMRSLKGRKELDGNKWFIEQFDGQTINLDVTLQQSVLISRCNKTTVILKGKANAISIDNSPRLQVLVETLVSSIDVIKSPNVAIQVLESVPTIMLDQVDGATLYIKDTEVFTSKCSGVNIVLAGSGDEDSTEHALPEQIRSVIRGGKVVSEIVEHAG